MKKEPMTPQNILRRANWLFYGGLVVCLLAFAIGAMGDSMVVMVVLAVVGLCAMFGGVIFCTTFLKCPDCGGSLMLGMRIPHAIPNFCPQCGKKL